MDDDTDVQTVPVSGDPFLGLDAMPAHSYAPVPIGSTNTNASTVPVSGNPFDGQSSQAADYTPMGDAPLTGIGARLSGYIADKASGIADSLGNAATLAGRALYGPESAGWDRYGAATPDQAVNAAGWVTMPSLGRAAAAGLPEAGTLGMSGASDVASGMSPKGIQAYHTHYGEPFDQFDFGRLGETVGPNVSGQSNEDWAMNLARAGAWAHERPLTTEMAGQSMPVTITGKGKHFGSLDDLHDAIVNAGGPEDFRQEMLDNGYGHVSVNDEEFGGKSYVALSPEHFRPFADPNSGSPASGGMLSAQPPSITAYHGSPHDFDRFDISKIGTGEGAQAGTAAASDVRSDMGRSLQDIRDAWKAKGVTNDVYYKGPNQIDLSRVVVPADQRGQGIGSAFMRDLTNHADETGRTIVLSPSTDFGATSVNRLKDFYKQFGFVENKGRNKDFAISDTMYRPPTRLEPVSGDPFAQDH